MAARTGSVRPPDWRDVRDGLERRDDLSLDELARLVEACWWLGDVPAYLAHSEVLHDRHAAAGRVLDAADVALRMGQTWAIRGDVALAQGWLSRAERLLTGLPRGPLHGHAAYLRAISELELHAETAAPGEVATELLEMGRTHQDTTLRCFGAALQGMTTVLDGDVEGFRDLDEAMTAIVTGRVDPVWAGDIYCSVIHLCEELGDLARMRSWTDSLAAWAGQLSSTFVFAGVTRVHQLQLLRAEGDWDTVERELGEWSDRLAPGNGWVAGVGYYELGEIHRLRGRDREAQECFDRARGLGIEPQPGEAQLLHAAGRTGEALDAVRVALAGARPLTRARILAPAIDIALAAGEHEWAEAAVAELRDVADRYGTPGLRADAAAAEAVWLVAAGRPDDAVPRLEEASRTYREQRHQYALARVHESLGTAHRATGDTAQADADEATARAILQRLGAAADLARLTPTGLPAGLTPREAEVLAEVSRGLTNREVARALVISEKTVGRHLESIFAKAGVTSRTAAAAWARRHHLV